MQNDKLIFPKKNWRNETRNKSSSRVKKTRGEHLLKRCLPIFEKLGNVKSLILCVSALCKLKCLYELPMK